MQSIRKVCVYCGSGKGVDPRYAEAANILGRDLADSGIGLVYGGGGIGLMGAIAKAVLRHGGHVTGIIPEFLAEQELALKDAQEMHVVDSMHTRKQMMFDLSDAFVALPGGIGTLEELVEQLTWSQLGQNHKPIVLASIDGFWDPFAELLDHMRHQAFIRPGLEVTFETVQRGEDILPAVLRMADERAPVEPDPVVPSRF